MWTSFIGFMASGKSTVTRRLQVATRRPEVSVDDEVVRRTGLSIPEIFARQGEEMFRRHESAALTALDARRNLIVATGGGVVETPASVDLLRKRGVVIWLDAAWDVVRARLQSAPDEERPLVGKLGWEGLEALFRRRRPLYAAAAHFRLISGPGSVDDLARTAMLRSLLWERRREGRRS